MLLKLQVPPQHSGGANFHLLPLLLLHLGGLLGALGGWRGLPVRGTGLSRIKFLKLGREGREGGRVRLTSAT